MENNQFLEDHKKMKNSVLSKYERAKIKVASIRGFYYHAIVFIIINLMLFILKHKFTFILINKNALGNPEFLEWIDWNVFGTTIVWGVVLVIHGIRVLGEFSLRVRIWEERQIQKYLNSNSN
ncbi:2TM domain-containing protein [uncultured Maribacter sp.]|uniref:2TM domain-containing protein n=1 Tax=uncultured Maribacter sp. TaxID=431308 RepID=UPI0030D93527|tara:strand:+ start:3292 stop:3657 length:366 start_codon:yes stop_codon:yes gene_type:complete